MSEPASSVSANSNTVSASGRTLLVGLGSPHGDDQIGWIVTRLVATQIEGLDAMQLATPIDLVNMNDDLDRLVVVDACRGTGDLTAAHRWVWPTREISLVQSAGTHSIGLPEVLQMAQQLGVLPAEVIVWGIEGRRFSPGSDLSSDLAVLIDDYVRQIALDCVVADRPEESD